MRVWPKQRTGSRGWAETCGERNPIWRRVRLKEKQAGKVHAALLKRQEQAGFRFAGHCKRAVVLPCAAGNGASGPGTSPPGTRRTGNIAGPPSCTASPTRNWRKWAERRREAAKALERQHQLASELQDQAGLGEQGQGHSCWEISSATCASSPTYAKRNWTTKQS